MRSNKPGNIVVETGIGLVSMHQDIEHNKRMGYPKYSFECLVEGGDVPFSVGSIEGMYREVQLREDEQALALDWGKEIAGEDGLTRHKKENIC